MGNFLRIGIPLVFLIFSQACSKFQSTTMMGMEEASSIVADIPSDLSPLDGPKLYAYNCASCHGVRNESAKKGRSLSELKKAIEDIPQMESLVNLSKDELQAIIDTLVIVPNKLKYKCDVPGLRGASEGPFSRFTKAQYMNTLTDLVGDAGVQAVALELSTFPNDELSRAVVEFRDTASKDHVLAQISVSAKLTDFIGDDNAKLSALGGACLIETAPTDVCVRAFITNFGGRVYRRPLLAAQIDQLFTTYTAARSRDGVKDLLLRLLLAPNLLMRIEGETPVVQETIRQKLDAYDVASRISYRITDSMPDAMLFAAAASGALNNLAEVSKQSERLLASPRGKAKIKKFFGFWLEFDPVRNVHPLIGTESGINTNGLAEEMHTETNDFIDHLIFTKKGNYKDFMTSRDAFPKSARMMSIIGTSALATTGPVETPVARQGILMRPATLNDYGTRTSIILRGAKTYQRVLCGVVGSPPQEAVDEALAGAGDLSIYPNKEAVTRLTSSKACVSCHTQINPFGFAFESFDMMGRIRTQETVYQKVTEVVGTMTAVSNENPTVANNGWGPLEKNKSNGDKAPNDGLPLSISGTTYTSGLGTHAPADIQYAIPATCNRLKGYVGVDDEVGAAGSVIFKVLVDGAETFNSGLVKGGQAAKPLDIDVKGKKTLQLIVTDADDGAGSDHADWADLKLSCGNAGYTYAAKVAHPVNTEANGIRIDGGSNDVLNAVGLVQKIAESTEGPACLARHVFDFYRLRESSATKDACALSDVERALKENSGNLLEMIKVNISNEDLYWKNRN